MGLKTFNMGALKLSVIEEQNKELKNHMRVAAKAGKPYRVSNCDCPCWCFIKQGEILMDDVEVDGSWNID